MKTLTNIPVAVHRGAFQNDAANAFVSAIAPEFESSDNQQDSNFGVDSHQSLINISEPTRRSSL